MKLKSVSRFLRSWKGNESTSRLRTNNFMKSLRNLAALILFTVLRALGSFVLPIVIKWWFLTDIALT